ncbi:MAG: RNA polymerase sigma factor SigF, partial [Mycolicibacterium sp.]|nr:RNA polymerase sigma factor SigF [Mycolicibacterium sp.]
MTSTLTTTTVQLGIDIAAPVPRAVKPSRSRVTDEYLDVVDMFHALHDMAVGSQEYHRQRERIIRRCMPMADHVALHFDRRGEALDDLVQVARVGLLNAVERFDPTRGSSFVAFAIPTMMGEV